MRKPPIPSNELERLKDLLAYDVLDSDPEKIFDDFALLASQICNTPIALISLVDRDRQWFKSKVGLSASETSREFSFCAHAINSNDIFEVPDSTLDERFKDNPLVAGEPKIRFYAGAPLITPTGNAIGTICVIDHEAKHLSSEQKFALSVLSRQIITQLELSVSLKRSNENYQKLQELGKIVFSQNERLIETAKSVTIGEMSRGIAHEINNPLAIIVGRCSYVLNLLEKKNPSKEELMTEVQKVIDTSERIARIVRAMRNLSRVSSDDPFVEVEFRELVNEVTSIFEEQLKLKSIELRLSELDNHLIRINPTQISQVLLNLFQNAIHAVSGMPERWISIRSWTQDGNFHFSVSDSGTGIKEDLVDKIMDPFFTTKPAGVGSGLGLFITKKIIEAHQGDFRVDLSQKNTCFVVTLPL